MEESAADDFWRGFLGVPAARWDAPGVHIVPHAGLGDYSGVWFFARGAQCIISAPSHWHTRLGALATRADLAHGLPEAAAVREIFGSDAITLVGPVWHGSLTDRSRMPAGPWRHVDAGDPAVDDLRGACSATEWEHAGLESAAHPWFAATASDRVTAIAALRERDARTVDVCVVGHPQARGQGFARVAVGAAIAHRAPGRHVLYQTLEANRPSVRLAEGLGFEHYARHLAVRLRP